MVGVKVLLMTGRFPTGADDVAGPVLGAACINIQCIMEDNEDTLFSVQ